MNINIQEERSFNLNLLPKLIPQTERISLKKSKVT
jgi:hypothetical protein